MESKNGIVVWLRQWITARAASEEMALRERAIYALTLPAILLLAAVTSLDAILIPSGEVVLEEFVADLGALVCLIGVYILGRRGRLQLSGFLLVCVYLAVVAFYTFREGYQSINVYLLLIAVVAAGLTVGARAGFVAATVTVLFYGLVVLAQERGWFVPGVGLAPGENVVFFSAITYLLAGLSAVFGSWVYRAARDHAQVLDRQMDALKRADEEKAGLLHSLQEQMAAQDQLLADLQASDRAQDELRSTLRQVTNPVVPVLDRVVVVPIAGALERGRIERLTVDILAGVEEHDAQIAILDVTGVPAVDPAIADGLMRLISAVGLLGAECVLVGIRPQVAQAVLDLGIDLNVVTSRRDLQSGVEYALRHTGRQIVSAQAHAGSRARSHTGIWGDHKRSIKDAPDV